MDRTEEIRERLSKATKGPWVYDKSRDTHDSCIHTADAKEEYGYIGTGRGCVVGSSEWIWIEDADGEFIAHARSDIEYLLAEIDRLKDNV